ncbi:MAG: hypothetical protein HOP13_07815 [Alphaproteobacteria bacterium]|nr:hypothetical protein [Alphaproteobacteria bacterium]
MAADITLRVIVRKPPPGVAFAMQSGSDALIAPVSATKTKLTFEATATLRAAADGSLRLSGPIVKGSGDKRFVYINSGQRAGQKETFWDRRAKVFLTDIGPKQLRACAAKEAVLETEIDGVGRDGGPCCATVPLLGGWRVV